MGSMQRTSRDVRQPVQPISDEVHEDSRGEKQQDLDQNLTLLVKKAFYMALAVL